MGDKRQKNQLVLAFQEESRSEAPMTSEEGTESLVAKRRVESPAIGEQLMEEVCERENCKQAFARVKANKQKSAVAEPWKRKFLGFSFTRAETLKRRIAPKAVLRFKERVRELTSRTRGVSIERMAEELARYLRGWIGYFRQLRNTERVARPRRMDPTPTAVGNLEAVEARDAAVRGTAETGCEPRPCRTDGGQRPRPVAVGEQPGSCSRIAQCLLRLAWDSPFDCAPIAQPTESPYTDPYVR